jgi:hypothetical protein
MPDPGSMISRAGLIRHPELAGATGFRLREGRNDDTKIMTIRLIYLDEVERGRKEAQVEAQEAQVALQGWEVSIMKKLAAMERGRLPHRKESRHR